ncbi:MAG: YdcF family protein [Actinomycetota bacterium]
MGAIRRHRIVSVLLALLVAVVAVVGFTAVAVWRAAHHDDASEVDSADLIVVLGAAQYDGVPSPVFAGRLDHAALLFEQGRATQVVVLGGNLPGDVSTEAEAGRDYLMAQGLPAASVVAEPVGHTTFESLRAVARWMRQHRLHSAFLVSDPWHNLRIERMAADLGFEGHASATWTSAASSEQTRLGGYVRETFAYLYYRVAGR